jgi:hypothetical protein
VLILFDLVIGTVRIDRSWRAEVITLLFGHVHFHVRDRDWTQCHELEV